MVRSVVAQVGRGVSVSGSAEDSDGCWRMPSRLGLLLNTRLPTGFGLWFPSCNLHCGGETSPPPRCRRPVWTREVLDRGDLPRVVFVTLAQEQYEQISVATGALGAGVKVWAQRCSGAFQGLRNGSG